MIFINDKRLALQLKINAVTEKEKFFYYLLTVVTFSFTAGQGIWLLFIDIPVLYYLYNLNNKGDSKAFIERLVCLSFPIALQGVIIFFILLASEMMLLEMFGRNKIKSYFLYAFPILNFILYKTYYYWRLKLGIKIACGLTEGNPN